ncbi:alpha-amylase [Epithele typhae]|uniref:alpha-amylase n=1 Tax=Epithele typhae TaxID=378194 RepID=UPI002008B409|nr:alpha-amylase [Epithele typhae]KAH9946352.1 alpha-amylase [Epithele typhae]
MQLLSLLVPLSFLSLTFAANADVWRKQSIYQIIVDRYALPEGAATDACDPGAQTWCGGTWNTIKDNLDYIQNMGFTAVWISPVSQNYEGERTPYGDPYHGYWISDATKLNSKFGTADDLKALSDELHKRGMLLMVDVVVNNVMSLSTDLSDLSTFTFKDQSQYHPYCPIQWGNTSSEQSCWLGDTKVALPDVNTQDPTVVSTYKSWISALVKEFNIDGLRIDAAKHVNMDFWPQFCGAADVFCIGEVFDADPGQALQYQGTQALDSILNYPLYNALVSAFTIPGPQNMSALVDIVGQIKKKSTDTTVLGNFLEDQDVPRWANMSVDPQSMWNAMIFSFLSDGIPIVYYGQEQGFQGNADPQVLYNREPLWPSTYANTTSYNLISKLNRLRNFMINNTAGWESMSTEILSHTDTSIVIHKGDVITVLTNIGSPPQALTTHAYTWLNASSSTTDILTCKQYAVGSNGTVIVDYSQGGVPVILMPDHSLAGSGLCGYTKTSLSTSNTQSTTKNAALTSVLSSQSLALIMGALMTVASFLAL